MGTNLKNPAAPQRCGITGLQRSAKLFYALVQNGAQFRKNLVSFGFVARAQCLRAQHLDLIFKFHDKAGAERYCTIYEKPSSRQDSYLEGTHLARNVLLKKPRRVGRS